MAESDGAGKRGRDPGSRTIPSNLSSRSHGIGFDNIKGKTCMAQEMVLFITCTTGTMFQVSPFVTSLPACFITIFYL